MGAFSPDLAAAQLLARRLTPRLTRYIPHLPTAKQQLFLCLDSVLEAFYGGSGGGGKSDALLMAALQYVDVPHYSALLLRRTYPELSKSGALMDRAHEWLAQTDARWNGTDKCYDFPSGARLQFGYLDTLTDMYQYGSAEFQYIGFDELTEFAERQYQFLFSRLRSREGLDVPLRMRSASNPGGLGHDWVRRCFIDSATRAAEAAFIPASLADNPHIRQEEYRRSLSHLDPVTRRQIEDGDWTARHGGSIFKGEWFSQHLVDVRPARARWVRFWDLAATKKKSERKSDDPDWTAGVLMACDERNRIWICDMERLRDTPGRVEDRVRHCAALDGVYVPIVIAQEPGSEGIILIDHWRRNVLCGHIVEGWRETGDKALRAGPIASYAEAGHVNLVRGPWVRAFIDELESFPQGEHDDQVDALSGGYQWLMRGLRGDVGGPVAAPEDAAAERERARMFGEDRGGRATPQGEAYSSGQSPPPW